MRRRIAGVSTALGVALCIASTAPLHAQDTVRITLPEAISLAAARNIDVLRAENALRSARARIESARGAFQPNLTLSAGPGVRYQLGTSQSAFGQQDNATGSFSVGLSSGYTLYNGNADRASLNQAEELARASDIGIGRTTQDAVFAVTTYFYDIATARELIGVARENLEAERRQLERVRAFTEARTRPISDLYAQEATLAAAELRLLEAERTFDITKLRLVQVLRLDPLGLYEFPAPAPAPASELTPAGERGLVEQALANRPEIAAQRARIEAAGHGIRVADAGDAPTLALSGSLGSSYSTTDRDGAFGEQLISQNPSAGVNLSFSLPLFDRNRTDAAEEQARIEYENELLTMVALRQQTTVEVRQALIDINSAQGQLAAANRQLAAARQGLQVEQARYETGVATLTELAQARARFVEAEGQVVQARNQLEMRRSALLFATGTLAAPRLQTQPPTEEEYGGR